MKLFFAVLFAVITLGFCLGCGKSSGANAIPFALEVPAPPTPKPQEKLTTFDKLGCTYSYLHESDTGKYFRVAQEVREVTYLAEGKESEVQKIELEDAFSRVKIEYRMKYDTSVLRLEADRSNATKQMSFEIWHHNKQNTQTPYPESHFSSTVKMGIHAWQIPANILIAGQKYNRASLVCTFSN